MINTKELERRWYKYKTKHVLLVLMLIFLLLALPYGLYYIVDYFTAQNTIPSNESKITRQPVAEVQSLGTITLPERNETLATPPPLPSPSPTPQKSDMDEVILSPTIPIIDLEQEKQKDREAQHRQQAKAKKVHHANQQQKSTLVKAKTAVALTPSELAVIQGKKLPHERKTIKFQTSSTDYIHVMQNKFTQNKNPREALLLAKAYYSNGQYDQSEEWALKANKLDKNLAESWFVFAKSKAKLGKEEEAIKILISYYHSTKSPQAKELIEKIRTRSI